MNVAYVGITRVKKNLYLPLGMKRLFTKQWQDYASHIPVISSRDEQRREYPVRKSSPPVRRAEYDGPGRDSYWKASKKKTGTQNTLPELNVGDTVRTPSGYGEIIKIEDGLYLVAMDNQAGRVWERRTALVKVQKLPPYKGYK